MRLFSKVREGSAFAEGSQNSRVRSVQPVVPQQLISDSAVEAQASTELSSAVMGVFCCIMYCAHVCHIFSEWPCVLPGPGSAPLIVPSFSLLALLGTFIFLS